MRKIATILIIGLMVATGLSGCVGEKGKETPKPPAANENKSNATALFEYKIGDEGLVVDASGSNDANGLPLRYIWEWGDGSKGCGVKTYYSYEEDGTYAVSLRVDNGIGEVGFANITIDTKDSSLAGTCGATGGAVLNETGGNKTNKWAIIDGVSDYPGSGNDLPDCHIDALNVYDYLVNSCGFPEENVFLFLNMTACPMNIKSALSFIINNTDENSTVVYYHSGHGGADPAEGETGVIESGFCVANDGWSKIYTIVTTEFKEWLLPLKSKKFVFISDSCQTGEMGGIGDSKVIPLTEGIASPGRIVITGSNEVTLASSTGEGGAFTIPFITWAMREKKGDGCSETVPPDLVDVLGNKDGNVSIQEAYWYTWWIMETGRGTSILDPEQLPEMTDNYGEPFYL